MDGAIPLPPPQISDEPMADAPTTHPYTIDTTDDNDSDWEYEYHPTETETQYIILDISSSQPVGAYPGKRRPRNDDTQPQPPAPSSPAQPQSANDSPPTTTPPPSPALPQITLENLSTPTPHLTHNNTLYQCTWSTTLGTDLLLTSPSTPSPPSSPTNPDITILGLSRLKLLARPITTHLQPHNTSTRTRPPTTTGHPVLERRERQTGFLERVAEMKKVRGEGDAVRMVGWRPGGDPRGRGRGRGRGRRVRRLGDLGVEVGDLGGRRVRWGDDVGGGALVEQEEEERLRSVVADEEILQGEEEEVGSEGFVEGEGRDQALLGEEEVGMGEEEVADMAADRDLRDDDDEDVAMGESR